MPHKSPSRPAFLRPVPLLLIAGSALTLALVAFNLRSESPPHETAASTTTYVPAEPNVTSALPEPESLPSLSDDLAPDFSLTTLAHGRFTLRDHQAETGKLVVLNLWASWCTPCRQEMPAIDRAASRYPNITFIGVAVRDDPVAAEEFATDIGVSYLIAVDEKDRVSVQYPSVGLPATFLIAPDGSLQPPVFGELTEERLDVLVAPYAGG